MHATNRLWIVTDATGPTRPPDCDHLPGTREPTMEDPVGLLGASLGCCLAQYVSRYLDRRGISEEACIRVQWDIEVKCSQITGFSVRVGMPEGLSDNDQLILQRMLDQCPVHRALGAVPVCIEILGPVPDWTTLDTAQECVCSL